MLGRIVSPADCAIAIALPQTKQQFDEDCRPGSPTPFIRAIKPVNRNGRIITPFERYQTDVLDPLNDLIQEATDTCVKVYPRVKLTEIGPICRRHPVVAIVAHWEYLLMPPGDVLDVALFRSLLGVDDNGETAHPPDPKSLSAALQRDPAIVAAKTKESLSAALSARLGANWTYQAQGEEIGIAPAKVLAGDLNRPLLEEYFPGCFAKGHSLELTDGRCTAHEFIEQLDDSFADVLDLTVCYSMMLAEAIKRSRPNSNVICSVGLQTIDARLVMLKWIIRVLKAESQPYEDASAFVHSALMAEIRRRRDAKYDPSSLREPL